MLRKFVPFFHTCENVSRSFKSSLAPMFMLYASPTQTLPYPAYRTGRHPEMNHKISSKTYVLFTRSGKSPDPTEQVSFIYFVTC